ncbi:2-hydroxychromene-2-carboxylate isomerase [Parvularcula sp. IMCC14364]|uniref:2-hydroxychromene-2-carboxylate isomerase n=1 Tax=Parvularcula sp. IMCC14364 TaxID=3067902 RepID=UPI0027426A5A|nr:2-hydroxychromene-2-carboxylate isomerase [Parvularcula sp. IMCC14364]
MAEIEFYFDFGSPNAYLSYKVLPEILVRTKAQLSMKPVLLGGVFKATNNQSPFVAMANIKGKFNYEQLEMQRFIQSHQLTEFQMNAHFPVNTLHVMRGAVVAEEDGYLDNYIDIVMAAMWEQSMKMDDPDVIAEVLASGGLDAARIISGSGTAEIKQKLIDKTEAAVSRGIFGIPTFFIGDEMWFGKDRLHQVEDYLLAE